MAGVKFNFGRYIEQRRICYKPVDDRNTFGPNGKMGFYNHCTDPNHKNIDNLEETFYRGDDVFYFYDVKLCHSMQLSDYDKFIKEYKRRGKTQSCAVHISNTTMPYENSQFKSLYDLDSYEEFIKMLIDIDSDIIVEISNKRLSDTPADEMEKIEKIYDILENAKHVKHYMVRHEVYKHWYEPDRNAPGGSAFRFDDNYENLIREVIRYDDLPYHINTPYKAK